MLSLGAIARALGGEVHGHRISCPGPGHSAKDRSLSVWFENGRLTCCSFAGDDWRDCMDYIRARCGLPGFEAGGDREKPQQRWLERPNERLEQISRLQKLAANAAGRRGSGPKATIPMTRRPRPICATAGFGCRRKRHGARSASILPARGRTAPACRRSSPASHRSKTTCGRRIRPRRFTASGSTCLPARIAKLSLGSTKGQVVKLSPDEDVAYGLHLCEGIETGLALMMRGWQPLWACCTEGTLRLFPPLAGIECLTIGADHDQAGLIAAQVCAERWVAAGREVLIRWPDGLGDDYADEVQA